jgi:hypothetical protein
MTWKHFRQTKENVNECDLVVLPEPSEKEIKMSDIAVSATLA